MNWRILDSVEASAEEQMAEDHKLLKGLQDCSVPVLRFYNWAAPSITYGHFLNPSDFLDQSALKHHGVQVAKRPTGGGMIFHIEDFPFSVLMPATHPSYTTNTRKNYEFINRCVGQAIEQFLKVPSQLFQEDCSSSTHPSEQFCMAKPTVYDVMIKGLKVCGGAQRRTRYGFLHQGTIALTTPSRELLEALMPAHPSIVAMMYRSGGSLLGPCSDPKLIHAARQQLKTLMKETLTI